jgi:ribosome recycling factor
MTGFPRPPAGQPEADGIQARRTAEWTSRRTRISQEECMLEDIKSDARTRMRKSLEALRHELAKIRTGRAHPSLLEHVHVDYYGSQVPINQAANVVIEDARTLAVTPWDKGMVAVIEKAILTSDLGLNPATAGQVIRIPLPPLTEERRIELGKVVHHEGENAKIAIRNIRRDAIHNLKELLREKEISEDEERRAETEIQSLTDEAVGRVDEIVAEKEKELLEI